MAKLTDQKLVTAGFAEVLRGASAERSAPPEPEPSGPHEAPAPKRMLRRSFLMSNTPGEEDSSFAALQLVGWDHMTRPK
jgi:hypothetical protein